MGYMKTAAEKPILSNQIKLTNMKDNKDKNFKTIEKGTTYLLPTYKVVDGKGIEENKKFCLARYVQTDTINNSEPLSIGFINTNDHQEAIEKAVELSNNFDSYSVINNPNYNPTNITFVRGDKTDGGEIITRVNGIVHEQLIGVLLDSLEYKNTLVYSEDNNLAITKIKEALELLQKRQKDREARDVVGTYKQ